MPGGLELIGKPLGRAGVVSSMADEHRRHHKLLPAAYAASIMPRPRVHDRRGPAVSEVIYPRTALQLRSLDAPWHLANPEDYLSTILTLRRTTTTLRLGMEFLSTTREN